MELVKVEKGDNMPIKALLEKTRKEKVLLLGEWLDGLLSLQGETSAKRLEVLLPMVDEFCWSISIEEIRKAFMKYIKGELPGLEPRTNYLDVILFGKVINAYKQHRTRRPEKLPEPEMTQDEKDAITADGALRSYNEYKELGMVLPGNSHIYDYLLEKGFLKPSENYLDSVRIEAKTNIRRSKTPLADRDFKKIVVPKTSDSEILAETKRLVLEKYFESKINEESE